MLYLCMIVMAVLGCNGLRCVINIILSMHDNSAGSYDSIVYAGAGEPTLNLEVLVKSASKLKVLLPQIPMRLNTNGMHPCVHLCMYIYMVCIYE